MGKVLANKIPIRKEDTPHDRIHVEGNGKKCKSGVKEVNAFEWEGDYRLETANRLRALLEERMDEELEQYLGRAKHERRERGDQEDYRNRSK